MGAAEKHLAEVCQKFAQVVHGHEQFPTSFEKQRDPYRALVRAVVFQQLSGKAAATIFGRFLDLFPRRYPEPRRLVRMTVGQLRKAGVSRQKAGYLRNVAAFARQGGLERARLERMRDEDLMERLTAIKGVGRWTVEMLLMFALGREDVFAVDDLGIQNAMAAIYKIDKEDKKFLKQEMLRISASTQAG